MAEELIFYTNPMSRGRIARWMLEETGVPYRTEVLEYGTTMKAEAYLAVNPMGKVPAIRHGDVVVTEAAAICAWLADAFLTAGLAPPTAERGPYYRWLFFAAGPLEAAVSNRFLGFEVPADKEAMIGYGTFAAVMDALEGAVSGGGYVAGDRFTAADVYVGSHIGWGLQMGSIERDITGRLGRVAVERWKTRGGHRYAMEERPWLVRHEFSPLGLLRLLAAAFCHAVVRFLPETGGLPEAGMWKTAVVRSEPSLLVLSVCRRR